MYSVKNSEGTLFGYCKDPIEARAWANAIGDCVVEKVRLLRGTPQKTAYWIQWTILYDSGVTDEAKPVRYSDWHLPSYHEVRYVRPPIYGGNAGRLEIFGYDYESVIRITNSWIARWRAGELTDEINP